MTEIHTLLLVPPPGDTALLADEAGRGRVPMRWQEADYYPDGRARWHNGRGDPGDTTALLLVHNGAPVATACDRAARVSDHPMIVRLDVETALMIAKAYVRTHPGAKVVALSADGQEVIP